MIYILFTLDSDRCGRLAVTSVSELVGVNDTLGPPLEDAIYTSIKKLELLLAHSISLDELPPMSNVQELALTIQNLLVGLNTLSKVIKSEQRLWYTAKLRLRALGIYRE